ncbi:MULTISPECIES: hypothetical protein [Halorubrum]|nr:MULTISPECIES: hypothetical protein [Halorubrum]
MLAFAVLSLFVTVFVVLGATVLAGTAILAGGVGFATPENDA